MQGYKKKTNNNASKKKGRGNSSRYQGGAKGYHEFKAGAKGRRKTGNSIKVWRHSACPRKAIHVKRMVTAKDNKDLARLVVAQNK